MSSLSKKAYGFLVKVKYKLNENSSGGSAVIIPIDGVDYAYILTAKHTFGIDKSQRSDNKYHIIDIENIKIEDIALSHPQNKFQILEVLNLTYDNHIDLIVFKIKKNEYIEKLSSLNIYEENFTKALVYGYPTMRDGDSVPYQAIDGTYRCIDLKNKFELHLNDFPNLAENQDTQDYVEGLSGAGVFVEDVKKEQIYLVGIVINSGMGNSIKCIDILALSKIINNKLEEKNLKPISISGAKWKNEFGFDMSDLDFPKVITDLSNKNKRNKFIHELNQYHDNPTKFMEIFDKSVKFDLKEEEKKLSEVSDIYLYLGMNFHEFKENKRATHYFNKAIKYGGVQNKSYLFDAKSKRPKNNNIKKKDDNENEFIETMVNALYENIYEFEEQLEIDKENSTIKKLLMESYKDIIIKLGFLGNRNEEIQKCRNILLELYDDFKEYNYIKEEIIELKSRINLNEQFKGMKNQVNDYQKEIQGLNKHIQLLSTHISDKTLLNQINYRVFNTDKKLDTVSKDISTKIDTNTNKLTKKLDEVKIAIIKTNNQKLNSFLENVYRSNQSLASKIQMMYHQNDRVNRKAKDVLNNSIQSMNNEISTLLDRPIVSSTNNNTQEIKDIVEACNWRFYKGIQGLCEKESDSYNRKLLEMSIAFTKREHELHIENLEKSHDIEILEIKKEADRLNSKRLTHISEQIDKSHQKLDSISKQVDRNYRQSLDNLIKIIQENNQNLIYEIEKKFPKIKGEFKSSLNVNKEKIKTVINLPIKHVKKVVEICNNSLYGKIEKLFNENKELSKQKNRLEGVIELTKKKNLKLISELEREHLSEIKKIEEEQIEWERGLDAKYKEKTHEACKKLISLTSNKQIKNLEKESQNLESKIKRKEEKNRKLTPYKQKCEEEEKLKEKKKKENEDFMKQIRLRDDLKNRIAFTFDSFSKTKRKIQALNSAFDNILDKLHNKIIDMDNIILTKKSEKKYFDMIKKIEIEIENTERIALEKIKGYNKNKEVKNKKDKRRIIIFGNLFLLIFIFIFSYFFLFD
jgi:hypothetical protein